MDPATIICQGVRLLSTYEPSLMLFSVAQIVKTRLKQNGRIIFDMSYVRTKDKNNVLIIMLNGKEGIICNGNKMQKWNLN